MNPEKAAIREKIHFWIYYGSLALLAISLPTSHFFISVSLELLVLNWLAGGNLKEKFHRFLSNKAAVAFSLIYLSYLIALLWTRDLSHALQRDLLHKLPTLIMPVIVTSSPRLDKKKLNLLLFMFIASVFVVSMIGLTKKILQPDILYRDLSPFMSGIYLGLLLVISAFQLPILVRQVSDKKIYFFLALAISAWFLFILFYIRALSGISSLTAASAYLLFHYMKQWRSLFLKIAAISAFVLLIVFTCWPIIDIYTQTHKEIEYDFGTLKEYTEYGTKYRHDTTNLLRENGYLVYINIADDELREAWNEKSEVDYYGKDMDGWDIRYTLYRYMSSMGLKKNKNDFGKLSEKDIHAVERGFTNYRNVERVGVYNRVHEELSGLYLYRKSSYQNPLGSSFAQRIDLLRASLIAFPEKPLFGWGTGSILNALGYGFESYGSPMQALNPTPHNQYLFILLTQGIIGFLIVFGLYTFTIVKTKSLKYLMFRLFIIIYAVLSLGNNPLEYQIGHNIFVFFLMFYCFLYPESEKEVLA